METIKLICEFYSFIHLFVFSFLDGKSKILIFIASNNTKNNVILVD